MSVEKRKARSIVLKLVVEGLRKSFDRLYANVLSEETDVPETTGEETKASGTGVTERQMRICTKLREGLNKIETHRRKKTYTVMKRKEIGGIPVEVTAAVGCRTDKIIIYLHGGAYVVGIAYYQRMYAETLASELHCPVVIPEYALAPENKFPAGLDDCYRLYSEIAEKYPKSRIILMGDSAGGGLSLSLTLRLKARGERLPDRLVLFSPVADLSGSIDRSINDDIRDDFILRKSTGSEVNVLYIGDADPKDPEVSPYYGDLHGFPPTFITCERREALYADSVWLDSELEDAGVYVRTIEMDGTFHVFPTLGNLTKETRRVTRDIAEFINS